MERTAQHVPDLRRCARFTGAFLSALASVGCSTSATPSTAAAPSEMQPHSGGIPAQPANAGNGVTGSQPSAAGMRSTTPAAQAGRSGSVSAPSDAGAAQPSGADAAASSNAAGSGAAGAAAVSGEKITFHNGGFWSDAQGDRIEAHGGGFLRVDDTWYWIGEDKSGNSAGFKGVNCYASKDLVTWEPRGAVLTRATAPELDTMDRIIERPKVSYNASTQRYVMWLHWEGQNYAEAKAGVFSSENVDGPYTFHSAFQPLGNMSRDDTLFVDDDGTAYFISAANENADLMVYQLTPDYLEIERHVIKLWVGQKREAPAMFKDAGKYYLVTSGATGWDPNQAKYATADAIAGPWSELRNLGNGTTFDTQPTYVIPVQGTQATTYIYAGDRWQDPDLASSKYVWLPLKLENGQLALDYYADWTLDLTTGEWSVDDGFIPQTNWRLLQADSEETEAENGRASNAFDDSASTIWHTAYTNNKPAPPHEIQVDLGASYELTGLRYLPRQDGVDYGTIADYALYISQDPAAWGDPVAMGSFAANKEPKPVTFAARAGRYVRFVALREINDKPYASIAELDLTGTPQ